MKVRNPERYTPGFVESWEHYPHYRNRSSIAESFRRWQRLKLEPLAAHVIQWIDEDESITGGQYTVAFERFLKKHDFAVPPETPSEAPCEDLEEPKGFLPGTVERARTRAHSARQVHARADELYRQYRNYLNRATGEYFTREECVERARQEIAESTG